MRSEPETATKEAVIMDETLAPMAAEVGQPASVPPFAASTARERGLTPSAPPANAISKGIRDGGLPASECAAPRQGAVEDGDRAPRQPSGTTLADRGAKLSIFRRPEWIKLHAPSAELQDLKDRYLSWMLSTRFAETTIRAAHMNVEWLYRFLGLRGIKRIADVTPEVLNDYSLWVRDLRNQRHEERAVGVRQVLNRLSGVKSFFEWLTGNMIMLCDPAADLELPKFPDSLPRVILTQDEVKKLLAAPDLRSPVGYRDKALLELVYATGIRTAELLRLKVSDFDFKARTMFVRQGKGGKDRVSALPSVTAGYVQEYVEKVRPKFARNMKGADDGTLFLNWTGGKLDRTRMCELFRKNVKLAGMGKPATAMTLRHSLGSHLLENGMPLRMIAEVLSHEKMETTTLYTRCTLTGLRREYNKHHAREKRVRKSVGESTAERGTI